MEQKKSLEIVAGIIILLTIIGFAGWYYTKGNFTPKTPSEESSPVVFKSNSYSGIVKSVSEEKIVIVKEDGNTEEYSLGPNIYIYDNRVRDAMKPITFQDIEKGMRAQISKTTNNNDSSENITLTLY